MLHDKILRAAVRLAKKRGFRAFTRSDVAVEVGCATGTVNYHFDSMDVLRMEVMREAIRREVMAVVAEGLSRRHVLVLRAPERLRRKAALQLI